MPAARVHIDSTQPAAAALSRACALFDAVGPERPVLLYGAELDAAAVVLGAYQHAPHALQAPALDALALPVLRRRTGGAAVWGSRGVLYFALGLAERSALMQCPPGKILNRNVRGLLAGIRALPLPAHYFGRDFVSVAGEPGAYLGWDEQGDGRVLCEFFVALDTPFTLPEGVSGYPPASEPALRGKQPTTIHAASGHPHTAAEVLAQLVQGYARGFDLSLQPEAPSAAELERAAELEPELRVRPDDDAGLRWSAPHEEAIGFISAGARLDAGGRIEAIRIGGDLYQHRDCPAQLQSRLHGSAPDSESIGAALDAVYAARPGLIEGVRSLTTLRSAALDALERAQAGG